MKVSHARNSGHHLVRRQAMTTEHLSKHRTPNRRNIMLAGTALAAASALGTGAPTRTAQAQQSLAALTPSGNRPPATAEAHVPLPNVADEDLIRVAEAIGPLLCYCNGWLKWVSPVAEGGEVIASQLIWQRTALIAVPPATKPASAKPL
jgi:hypothetical protein